MRTYKKAVYPVIPMLRADELGKSMLASREWQEVFKKLEDFRRIPSLKY